MALLKQKADWIKARAKELGFLSVGIAKAELLEEEAVRLKEWLGLNYHGEMKYMENHYDKRVDPRLLVEGGKSVICFSYNYYTEQEQLDPHAPKISKYAYGRDYHKVIKKKLKTLWMDMQKEFGEFGGRYFVDSAPVMERDWANRSGLGWIGKNTLLINPKQGSYFFLAEMIVDFELLYDQPIADHCGTCTRCIDACPTDAIDANGYLMDATKCISYLTIELKEDDIPEEFKDKMENWMYGCDICQDVCPWNRFSSEHQESDFIDNTGKLDLTKEDWNNLTESEFNNLFFASAVKRTKYKGLKRNIDFLTD